MGGPDAASLLRSLDRWDQAWANHNADDLKNLLSPNCTLHAGKKHTKYKILNSFPWTAPGHHHPT